MRIALIGLAGLLILRVPAEEPPRSDPPGREESADDPRATLRAWLRGQGYHEPAQPIQFELKPPDLVSSLENPIAGPAYTSGHYGALVRLLSPEAQLEPPRPRDLVARTYVLWREHWRLTLGFAGDPDGEDLLRRLEKAMQETARARARLEELVARTRDDAEARLRLFEQIRQAGDEAERLQSQEKEMRALLEQRVGFIRAMAELLRLAPHGGFGPTFLETADFTQVQADAAKVLAEIGPLTAAFVWNGLAEDLAWLAAHQHDGDRQQESVRRARASEALQAALKDPRLDGLRAVCEYLQEPGPPRAEVCLKAFELLDRLGAKRLRPEPLRVLPRLIELRADARAELAARARWVLLRLLKARGGEASLEDAIGHLAPLLNGEDTELAESAWQFLRAHTGQDLSKDPQPWLALQARMAEERLRLKKDAGK